MALLVASTAFRSRSERDGSFGMSFPTSAALISSARFCMAAITGTTDRAVNLAVNPLYSSAMILSASEIASSRTFRFLPMIAFNPSMSVYETPGKDAASGSTSRGTAMSTTARGFRPSRAARAPASISAVTTVCGAPVAQSMASAADISAPRRFHGSARHPCASASRLARWRVLFTTTTSGLTR